MAIQKSRLAAPEKPDAAAFCRLIDEGRVEWPSVVRAYERAVRQWAVASDVSLSADDIADVRPEVDPDEAPTPEARLILLGRALLFGGGQ